MTNDMQAARERGTDLDEIHLSLQQNGKEFEAALSDLAAIVNKLQEPEPQPELQAKSQIDMRYSDKLTPGAVRDLYNCAEGGAQQVKSLNRLIAKLSKIV